MCAPQQENVAQKQEDEPQKACGAVVGVTPAPRVHTTCELPYARSSKGNQVTQVNESTQHCPAQKKQTNSKWCMMRDEYDER
eukprot:5491861-Amphidinium_carterae.2